MGTEHLIRAFREAARSLRRTPGFTLTAVLSIGGAIGLAGSIGTVTYAAFFGRFAYPEPERLLELWQTSEPGNAQPSDYLDPVRMLEWVGVEARHLEGIAASGIGPTLMMGDGDEAVRVTTAPIAGDWFETMGVAAARGRVLVPDDARAGAEPAAVASGRFSEERGAELGSTLELSGVEYTVVGVMPREFEATERVWIALEGLPVDSRPVAYAGVARVRPGSTVAEATGEIHQMAAAQVAADSGRYAGLGATARPYGSLARGPNRPRLWMLTGVVVAVILIGASNLTQLFLVRAQARSPAMAVRGALGGNRWQIAGGLAAEGVLLGALGGLIGLLLTVWGKDVVRAFLGSEYAFATNPAVGPPILALVAFLALFSSGMLAAEPLRRAGALHLAGALQRRMAGSSSSHGDRRTQRFMVAVQVAICVVLVAMTNVLASAYRGLYRIEMGYDDHEVVQAIPDYGMMRMDVPAQWDFARAIAARLGAHPAISAVAVWEKVGEDYPPRPDIDAVYDGPPREIGRRDGLGWYYAIEPGFFEAMGIELLAGRVISTSDGAAEPLVAVVTKNGADAWWPGEDPLGHQVRLGQQGAWMTVVGVVEEIRALDELGRAVALTTSGGRMPFLFASYAQLPTPPVGWRPIGCCAGVMIGVRPTSSQAAAAQALQAELVSAAPGLPVRLGTMARLQVADGYSGSQIALTGRMVGAGSVIAILLAILGVVGVVREGLQRRTREIGVRIALGAPAHTVVAVTARESIMTALLGVLIGLIVLFPLDRLLAGVVFNYDVQRLTQGLLDPTVLALSSLAVMTLAGATSAVAAARAARLEPATSLRSD